MANVEQLRLALAQIEGNESLAFVAEQLRSQLANAEAKAEQERITNLYTTLASTAEAVCAKKLAPIMIEGNVTEFTLHVKIDSEGNVTLSAKSGARSMNVPTGAGGGGKRKVIVEGVEYPSMSAAIVAHGYEYKRDAVTGTVTNGLNYAAGVKWLEGKSLKVVQFEKD